MSPFLSNTVRRFSRSSSKSHKEAQSPSGSSNAQPTISAPLPLSTSSRHQHSASAPATGANTIAGPVQHTFLHQTPGGTNSSAHNSAVQTSDSRPISSATEGSFDFAGRPVLHYQRSGNMRGAATTTTTTSAPGTAVPMSSAAATAVPPASAGGYSAISNMSSNGLSRTDMIVLKHFWDAKYQENIKRDLHYLKFPFFPQFPMHNDLLPYCEIYHLVKTSPGASIVSLGSANGVYIGFELQTGSQLHIDMDDEWHNIAHYRVQFKSYDTVVRDLHSEQIFKTWPKPLTIEFLEEEYQKWCMDLMSLCWEGKEVRELGGVAPVGGNLPTAGNHANGATAISDAKQRY